VRAIRKCRSVNRVKEPVDLRVLEDPNRVGPRFGRNDAHPMTLLLQFCKASIRNLFPPDRDGCVLQGCLGGNRSRRIDRSHIEETRQE
jgi:hypothetical protein